MVTHQSTDSPRWRLRVSLVGAAALIAISSACAPGVESDTSSVGPLVAANGAESTTKGQPSVACGEFCQELNQLVVVVAEAGPWVLNDVGYVDRPLPEGSLAKESAVGTYTFDHSTATVAAYKFTDDGLAAEFAQEYVTANGEPDHKGPAYQDGSHQPFGSRLDFDLADADTVLWHGQNGNLFILETPPGLGNDFYLSFEW